MARYLLNTDTCSFITKRSNQTVLTRLQAIPVTEVCISVITKSELLYGVEVSPRRTQDDTALKAFLPHVEVLGFPDDAATHYAQIRADLRKRHTAEFGRVKGLTVENWTRPRRRSRSIDDE
jgi:tRNA(fMet)-specific endonuclease VapC